MCRVLWNTRHVCRTPHREPVIQKGTMETFYVTNSGTQCRTAAFGKARHIKTIGYVVMRHRKTRTSDNETVPIPESMLTVQYQEPGLKIANNLLHGVLHRER